MSSVEVFVTGSKNFDRKKCAWLSLQKLLLAWFLWVKGRIGTVRSWSFDLRSLDVTLIPSLIGSQRGLWSLDSILIPVTNASTQDLYVTTPWLGLACETTGKSPALCTWVWSLWKTSCTHSLVRAAMACRGLSSLLTLCPRTVYIHMSVCMCMICVMCVWA